MLKRISQWLAAHPLWALAVLTVAVLAPFLAKPFNIDDPLFLWAAKQIAAHPLDPYGFDVNWGWTHFPMFKVTENPPLACYYLASAGVFFGWSEMVLHAAFLPPAIAVVLGTYRLAKKLCAMPFLAAGLVLGAPVFLVSATSVMCDVMMLALWVWAVIFWLEGAEENSRRKMLAAGMLIALAALTKYFAVSLVPLLVVHSLMRRQPLAAWGPSVIIVLLALAGYQFWTEAAYHQSLLYRAADYAVFSQKLFGFSKGQNVLIAFGFVGGCVSLVAFLAPTWMNKRELIPAAAVAIALAVIVFNDDALWEKHAGLNGSALLLAKSQLCVWASAGVLVLWLALTDWLRRRDAASLMLMLWVAGVFAFTAFCNWTVNGRSILPLAPAVAILVVRRLQTLDLKRRRLLACGVAASIIFAWFIAAADVQKAYAVRETTRQVVQQFDPQRQRVWFQGHWGFQYYMQLAGARPVDFKNPALRPGDLMVIPADNTNQKLLDATHAELLGTCGVPSAAVFATLNQALGAGFYASALGPLPFVLGNVPPEMIAVYRLK